VTTPIKWLPKKDPWLPPDHDEAAIYAIRALASGTANDGQQKTAWAYLMYVTGASEEFADLSYRTGPQGDRDTAFAEGKRFVGLQLRKLFRPELTPHGQIGEPHSELPSTARRSRSRASSSKRTSRK
jgi:hypothetical protein